MNSLNTFIWTCIFLPAVFILGGILTIGSGFMQFRHFGHCMRVTVGRGFGRSKTGGPSPLQAASTALASTVGIGNIVGTAQAISMGGPGAVFWLWVTALFGMMVKYAEIFLSLRFRKKADGTYCGGPMYYIAALGKGFAPLAFLYALFAAVSALGMGNLSQINGAAEAFESAAGSFIKLSERGAFLLRLSLGLVLALLLLPVLNGGAKKVGQVTELLVPFMGIAFMLISLAVIICHAQRLPHVLRDIFLCALSPKAAAAAAGGIGTRQALIWGIRRSAFSNEAGLGSSAIAHAAVETDNPIEHSLWGVFEVFADTILICSATALCILCSGISVPWGSAAGSELLQAAFSTVFSPTLSSLFMSLSILLFAFATVIGWSFYGLSCVNYLSTGPLSIIYKLIVLICLPLGCIMSTESIWILADTANALMCLPNLAALSLYCALICRETKIYEENLRKKS